MPAEKQLVLAVLVLDFACAGIQLEAQRLCAALLFLHSHVNSKTGVFLHTDLVGDHPFTERGLLGRS